jgi:hypothetical protein
VDNLLRNLDLLNKKFIEISLDKINPNTLKDYISLVDVKNLTNFVKKSIENETDPIRIEILSQKISYITADISKTRYSKKTTFSKKISAYFYPERVDLYIKKDFEKESFDQMVSELPQFNSFKVFIDNKELSIKDARHNEIQNLKLEYENVTNFLNKIINKNEIKLRLFIQPH